MPFTGNDYALPGAPISNGVTSDVTQINTPFADIAAALTTVKTEANGKQASDATLTSLAALGTASGKFAYTTDVDTWAEATITEAGRALLDDADAAAQRTTLGLGTAATTATTAYATAAQGATADSALQSVVGGTQVTVDATDPQNPIVSFTGAGTGDLVSSNNLSDIPNTETARANLGVSIVGSLKETLALAIADTPTADPTHYEVSYFDTTQQIGSGATWKKVSSNPGLATGAAFQNGNGTWYVNNSEWLAPQQFGRVGVNAAGDTTLWVALVSAANHRGGKIKIRISDEMNLNGTGTASDSQTFTNFSSLWIRGDDVEVYQHNSLSKTFKFIATDAKVKVTGIEFVGYAEQQINAATTPTEIDFDSSSGNAVAAVYAEDLYQLDIKRVSTRNHAGRDVWCRGVLHLKGRDLDLVGLGPTYNDPVGDAHQGNGEDAAIYHIPKLDNVADAHYEPDVTNAWRQTLDICNSRITWHSFGIRTILNAAIILHGNRFEYAPGQHHVYDTDSDGHSIIGNQFGYCRQIGYKMQMENTSGLYYGPLWAATTAYAVGDVVRSASIAWICHTAHTSGGSFVSTNWDEHPRHKRRGAVIQGNTFDDCTEGVGIIEASGTYGRNIWAEGYVISGNTFNRCSEAMYIDRCWEATIANNNTHSCEYGVYGRNFSGKIEGNGFWDTGKNCVYLLGVAKASAFEGNVFGNYGQTGSDNANRSAVLILDPDTNEPPAVATVPKVYFNDNGFLHYVKGATSDAADAPGDYLVWSSDTACVWEINDTYGTSTTKIFRIDGTVSKQSNNHFEYNGYYNTAQNAGWKTYTPTYTASSGTLGTVTTTSARYRQDGRVVTVSLDFTITADGGATGVIRATLPVNATYPAALSGFEDNVLGSAMRPAIRPGDLTKVEVADATGSGVVATGRQFVVTGVYEVSA